MVINQIHASDVDQRIISSQIFQNWTLQIRKFTGTPKILKLVRKDQLKYTRRQKKVQTKVSHRIYKRLWHICLPIQKSLKDI